MKTLRILIQHRQTKEFYKNAGSWTPHEADALEFSDVLTAFNLAVQDNFEEMEIIFARRATAPDRSAVHGKTFAQHATSVPAC